MKIKSIVFFTSLVLGANIVIAMEASDIQGAEASAIQAAETISETVGFIDINQADSAMLSQLQGIGDAKARAIVEYRERYGPFTSIDALADVSGISQQIVDINRERLFVDG